MEAFATLQGMVARSIGLAAVYGRPIAEGSMVCQVLITRNGSPAWDALLKTTTTGYGEVVYSGPANVEVDSSSTEIVIGDNPVRIGGMVAIIPIGAPMPQVDDVLIVLSGADPNLLDANNAFRVTSVSRGGMVPVSRRLQLESLEASSQRSLP